MKIDSPIPAGLGDIPAGRAWAGMVVMALTVLLAGCGAGQSPQPAAAPPPTPAVTADPNKPCTLLSPEAVGAVFRTGDMTSQPRPDQPSPNGYVIRECEYFTAGRSVGGLSVRIADGTTSATQYTDRLRQRTPGAQPVAGVGEAALYYLDQETQGALVHAAKAWHGKTMSISYIGSSRASQEQLTALVKQAIDAA
jgi:hypothetical protein